MRNGKKPPRNSPLPNESARRSARPASDYRRAILVIPAGLPLLHRLAADRIGAAPRLRRGAMLRNPAAGHVAARFARDVNTRLAIDHLDRAILPHDGLRRQLRRGVRSGATCQQSDGAEGEEQEDLVHRINAASQKIGAAKYFAAFFPRRGQIKFQRTGMQRGFRNHLIAASLALAALATPGHARAAASVAIFAGHPIRPGETVRADVPLSATERQYASERGNTPPAQAVAVVAVPPGFDPHKTWPVLVIFATDDLKRLDRDDLAQIYRRDALAAGWVVLAGDGPAFPRHGTSAWRAGMTLAALEALYRSFPGSSQWPVACAGYSGGAKHTGDLAPLLAVAGCRMIGIFLTGINVDRLSPAYAAFRPGRAFLHTPVFISAGRDDKIAEPFRQMEVNLSLKKTGFDQVRFETFPGGHAVKRTQLQEALRWFRASAGLASR